jgi:hypothetical protein
LTILLCMLPMPGKKLSEPKPERTRDEVMELRAEAHQLRELSFAHVLRHLRDQVFSSNKSLVRINNLSIITDVLLRPARRVSIKREKQRLPWKGDPSGLELGLFSVK